MDAVTHYSVMAVEAMAAQLDAYTGRTARPANGCRHARVKVGEAPFLVEFEYEPEEGDGWELPHYPARATVCKALVNGAWVDPEAIFSADVIEAIEDDIMRQRDIELRAAREPA